MKMNSLRRQFADRRSSTVRQTLLLASFILVASASVGKAQTCSSAEHSLTFTNKCAYPLWLAESASPEVVPGNWELAAACTKDSQCASGQTCNKAAAQCTCATNSDCGGATCQDGLCANTTSLCMPIGWNGRFWPRTNCHDLVPCSTNGDCTSPYNTCFKGQCVYSGCSTNLDCQALGGPYQNNPNDQCTSGMCFVADSGQLPNNGGLCQTGDCSGRLDCGASGLTANGATLFEATFSAQKAQDNYDISLVSGYNVPARVTLPGIRSACTLDGIVFSGTGGCAKDLNATCPEHLQVTVNPKNGSVCQTDSDCPPASACNRATKTCVIACLHPYVACLAANPDPALNCSVYNGLYTCDSPNESCNKGATVCFTDHIVHNDDCPPGLTCDTKASDFGVNPGMPDGAGVCKPPAGTNIPKCDGTSNSLGLDCSSVATPSTQASGYTCNSFVNLNGPDKSAGLCLPPTSGPYSCCGPANSDWMTAALTAGGGKVPYVSTFKDACPVAYSYQYDDKTGNPFCTNPANSLLSYSVTFCPSLNGVARQHK
jgi:hypothetical protein